jgi:hypothetical protein
MMAETDISKKSKDYPAWIRTRTKRAKISCATVTLPGTGESEGRLEEHGVLSENHCCENDLAVAQHSNKTQRFELLGVRPFAAREPALTFSLADSSRRPESIQTASPTRLIYLSSYAAEPLDKRPSKRDMGVWYGRGIGCQAMLNRGFHSIWCKSLQPRPDHHRVLQSNIWYVLTVSINIARGIAAKRQGPLSTKSHSTGAAQMSFAEMVVGVGPAHTGE